MGVHPYVHYILFGPWGPNISFKREGWRPNIFHTKGGTNSFKHKVGTNIFMHKGGTNIPLEMDKHCLLYVVAAIMMLRRRRRRM